jgi:hypothetical protein
LLDHLFCIESLTMRILAGASRENRNQNHNENSGKEGTIHPSH